MIKGLFLILLLVSSPALAATKYVTQTGAGTGDGTGVANAYSVSQFNARSFAAGETIIFSGTITSTVSLPSSGSSGNRITYDFSSATLNTANPRISMNGKSHINVYGGMLGPSSNGTPIGGNDTPASNITISGWSYTGNPGGVANFIDAAQMSDLLIENNNVDNVLRLVSSFRATSHDITIRNNYVRSSNNTTDQTDLIFVADAANVVIEGNILIGRAPGDCCSGSRHNDLIQTFRSGATPNAAPSNWTIRYNWLEMQHTGGDRSNSWLMLEHCAGNFKIYGNVFYDYRAPASLGIEAVNAASSVAFFFYNNTVVRKGANMPTFMIRFNPSGTLHARNNILMSEAKHGDTMLTWAMSEGSDWNRNFIYNDDATCNSTLTGSRGSCSTNPNFNNFSANQFWLGANSKLIGAGDGAIGAEYDRGIQPGATWPNPALVPRGSSWDPGAYVYEGAAR